MQKSINQTQIKVRDDLVMYKFRTKLCKRKYRCQDPSNCFDAHSRSMLRRVPRQVKSNGMLFNYIPEPCQEWQKSKKCRMGINCPRSHGWLEIIFHPLLYKTKLCKCRREQGVCSEYGVYCAKAHTSVEIRSLTGIYGVDWKRHYDLTGRVVAVRSKNRCSRPKLNFVKSRTMERDGLAVVPKKRHMIDLNLFAEYILDKQISKHDDPPTYREQGSHKIEHLKDSDIPYEDLGFYDYDEKQSEGNRDIMNYTHLYSSDAKLNGLNVGSPVIELIANQQDLGYYDITSPTEQSPMVMSGTPSPEQYDWENNAPLFPYNYGAFFVNSEDNGYDFSFQE